MKILNIFIITVLTVFAIPSFAHESMQAKIIELLEENRELEQESSAVYEAGRVCYDYESECHNRAKFVRLLANGTVSINAFCHREPTTDQNDDCYGSDWVLTTKIRILK